MTAFQNATATAKTQAAIQIVLMDAIEKGHTNPAELVEYMASHTFEAAVKSYLDLMG